MTPNITKLCHYAEWHDAECRVLFVAMLNVTMQSAVAPRAALAIAPAPAPLFSKNRCLRKLPFSICRNILLKMRSIFVTSFKSQASIERPLIFCFRLFLFREKAATVTSKLFWAVNYARVGHLWSCPKNLHEYWKWAEVWYAKTGKPDWSGRLSTVDLLVLTTLDELLLIMQTKQVTIIRRPTVLTPLQLVFPGQVGITAPRH
jgi:hypothetical protein